MGKEYFKSMLAVYLVLMREGKVLLLRRANIGYGNGQYSLVAGHVESNESIAAAMIREAKEESDIVIEPHDLQLAHVLHYTSNIDGYTATFHFFVAEKWQGEIVNTEPEKCSDLSWFPIDQLPKNTIPYILKALECIAENKTYSEFGWE